MHLALSDSPVVLCVATGLELKRGCSPQVADLMCMPHRREGCSKCLTQVVIIKQ